MLREKGVFTPFRAGKYLKPLHMCKDTEQVSYKVSRMFDVRVSRA